MKKKPHRGRFQAQGNGLEASETWAQDEPLSKADGFELLSRLKSGIPKKESLKRKKQFAKARQFIDQTEGGIDAPFKKSFRNLLYRSVRVDIEIWSGRAFISLAIILILLLWILN